MVFAYVENVVSYAYTDVNKSNLFDARRNMRGSSSFKAAQKLIIMRFVNLSFIATSVKVSNNYCAWDYRQHNENSVTIKFPN
jgi:hypothetical protein